MVGTGVGLRPPTTVAAGPIADADAQQLLVTCQAAIATGQPFALILPRGDYVDYAVHRVSKETLIGACRVLAKAAEAVQIQQVLNLFGGIAAAMPPAQEG